MTRHVLRAGPWLALIASMTLAGCAFAQAPRVPPTPAVTIAPSGPGTTGQADVTATPGSSHVAPAGSVGPAASIGPVVSGPPAALALPDCRYADVPVDVDPATDWATVVVDTIYRLPKGYAPTDLVSVTKAGLNAGYKVSRVAIADLRAMASAARDAGTALAVQSAFRSYQYQVTTFDGWVASSNEAHARTVSARPGHSEHQLGTAIDFRSAADATPPWQLADFAATPAGAWLRAHAWEFGFVLSYPKGESAETCYAYEPWHYRYVGRDVAAAIHASGQTPRRYLWETYGPGSAP